MKVFTKIQAALANKQPFVVYRKPGKEVVSGVFQKSAALHVAITYAEAGFVFAPFDAKDASILFPFDASVLCEEPFVSSEAVATPLEIKIGENSKNTHIQLLQEALKRIAKGDFEKVVLSRKEVLRIPDNAVTAIFERLLSKYKNAFVYVWYHPSVGLWLGATPELLLAISGTKISTMALAGTQPYTGTLSVDWKEKELVEQQFVTDYIEQALQPLCTAIQKSKTSTVQAGSLVHLKTTITGELAQEKSTLEQLIKALHPTPAVCGLPRAAAKAFILKNESYNRSFYTGFLGELNYSQSGTLQNSSLFVNLRCMEISKQTAAVFVGGGITKDSDPEKEWEETVSKSRVMRSVL